MPPIRNGFLRFTTCLAIAFIVFSPTVKAKSSDRAIPAKADGKKFSGNLSPNSKSQLDGAAVITQGSLKITGEHADLYTNQDTALTRAVVRGGKAHLEQLDDANLLMTADAQNIDYNVETGVAVLTGSAHAQKQTGGSVSGDVIHYDTSTGTFDVESTGSTLTHLTFYPKQPTSDKTGK